MDLTILKKDLTKMAKSIYLTEARPVADNTPDTESRDK
jgi:hypothetical protein